jgi:hypothetical protein
VRPSPAAPSCLFAAIAKISQLGRPIWITELNWALNVRNDTLRAHLADLTLRELFSNPLVHHIALQHIVPSFGQSAATCPTCLFDENNVPNEVGQVFLNLRKEWSTLNVTGTTDGEGNAEQYRGETTGRDTARIGAEVCMQKTWRKPGPGWPDGNARHFF